MSSAPVTKVLEDATVEYRKERVEGRVSAEGGKVEGKS